MGLGGKRRGSSRNKSEQPMSTEENKEIVFLFGEDNCLKIYKLHHHVCRSLEPWMVREGIFNAFSVDGGRVRVCVTDSDDDQQGTIFLEREEATRGSREELVRRIKRFLALSGCIPIAMHDYELEKAVRTAINTYGYSKW